MAAGSGEEVSPDVIRAYNEISSSRLSQMSRQGLSNQRVALINEIIARREAGAESIAATQQGAKPFAEARRVSDVQTTRIVDLPPRQLTRPRETITIKDLPPRTRAPVTAIDTSEGGFVIRGDQGSGITTQSQFSGRVEESVALESGQQVKPTTERFFVRGQEVGEVRTLPSGQQVAITRRPARLEFAEERRGTVSSIMFGSEGAELIEETQTNFPQLNMADVGDVVNFNNPYARQGLPALERLKFSYESAGKTQYGEPSIRGAIRAGFELGQIGLEKLPIYPKLAKYNFPISTQIPEDIFISGLLLTPSTPTTAQIEKELFSISRVRLAGVTQAMGKTKIGGYQKVTTQAGFTVERNAKFVRGVVNVKSIQNQQAVLSTAKGKTFVRAYNFPTAKEVITPKISFKAADVTRVIQRDKLFFSKSYGTIRESGTLAKGIYRGEAVAQQFTTKQGKFIIQLGASQLEKGGLSYSTGILKIKPSSSPTIFFTPTTTGAQANLYQVAKVGQAAPLKAVSLQVAKNIVGAAVKIPPQRISNIMPVVSVSALITPTRAESIYAGTGLYERTEGGQVPTILTSQRFIQAQDISSLFRAFPSFRTQTSQRTNQLTRTLQATKQVTKQEEIQKQIPRQFQIPKQQTQQRQKVLQLSRFLQIQESQSRSLFRFRTPTTRTPAPKLFFYPKVREPTTQKQFKFSVLLRRFGQFRTIGYGRTELEALNIGSQAAAKTLGATFKVPSAKARNIFGFKTKISKKEGILFIEKPKYRLSKRTEVKEIQYYKRMKGGNKRR